MGALRRLRALPRWLVVDLPCRFYLSAEDRGSRPVWIYFVGWLTVVAGCVAGGAVVGLAGAGAFLDGVLAGLRFGLLAVLAWIAYAVLFLLVLWFRGESPVAVLNRDVLVGPAQSRSRHGRQATDVGWRRPGDHLVSRGWLVLVACVTAVTGLVALWAHQQAVDEDRARAIADNVAASAAETAVPAAAPARSSSYWALADGSRLAAYGLIALTVLSLVWYVVERRVGSPRRPTSRARPRG